MVYNKYNLCCGIVSDVLDMLGHTERLLGADFRPNFPSAMIWGKVRTIQLKPIERGDDPNDVHGGLALLETLTNNDIIVVAGGSPKYAYWGELMSTTAKMKGCIGTIVDGVSRDFNAVINMKYPVFSKGSYGRDIKNRGIVTGIDIPVTVDGIYIQPGDWLFADVDGIAIIPVNLLNEFEQAIEAQLVLETKVKKSILEGVQPTALIKKHGVF